MRTYVFDTSAFLGAWIRRLPSDVFPTFWKDLDALVRAGEISCPDVVFDELKHKDDGAFAWVKTRKKHLISALEPRVMKEAARITIAHKGLVRSGGKRSGGDPFVIAHGKVHGLCVVTDEKPGLKKGDVKIPNVCEAEDVPCIDLYDFMRQVGWSY